MSQLFARIVHHFATEVRGVRDWGCMYVSVSGLCL